MRKLYNRFNPKTNTYEFSTGSSGVIISSIDMQAILASILAQNKTTPLDIAHLYACQQFGSTEHSLEYFLKLLTPFMYNRLIAKSPSIKTEVLIRHHKTIVNALDEVTECVFRYLTRHKVKEIRIRAFMPQVLRDTFRRHYNKFLRGVIGELESRLDKLEYQIFKKAQENNTFSKII